VVIDEEGRRLYEKRPPNELIQTLRALEPFIERLKSCVVESTFNWYGLVDGLSITDTKRFPRTQQPALSNTQA